MDPVADEHAQSIDDEPALFICKPPPNLSAPMRIFTLALVGAAVGAVGWYEVDRTMTAIHIACWVLGGAALLVPLAWWVERNPVLSIGFDETGLTLARKEWTRTFAWSEIEAARIQIYESGHGPKITAFLLRAGGETFELTPDFIDEATREAFEDRLAGECADRNIPEATKNLPSFEWILSLGGAFVFIASIVGLIGAHAAGYHTLGTIFGLAFLFTGSIIAFMTRRERISRFVLAATLLLIIGGTAILWACHVNVREVLQRWDWIERANK